MIKKAFFSVSVISVAVAVLLLFGAQLQDAETQAAPDSARQPASVITTITTQSQAGPKFAQ